MSSTVAPHPGQRICAAAMAGMLPVPAGPADRAGHAPLGDDAPPRGHDRPRSGRVTMVVATGPGGRVAGRRHAVGGRFAGSTGSMPTSMALMIKARNFE